VEENQKSASLPCGDVIADAKAFFAFMTQNGTHAGDDPAMAIDYALRLREIYLPGAAKLRACAMKPAFEPDKKEPRSAPIYGDDAAGTGLGPFGTSGAVGLEEILTAIGADAVAGESPRHRSIFAGAGLLGNFRRHRHKNLGGPGLLTIISLLFRAGWAIAKIKEWFSTQVDSIEQAPFGAGVPGTTLDPLLGIVLPVDFLAALHNEDKATMDFLAGRE
jgi:hypothetical protein